MPLASPAFFFKLPFGSYNIPPASFIWSFSEAPSTKSSLLSYTFQSPWLPVLRTFAYWVLSGLFHLWCVSVSDAGAFLSGLSVIFFYECRTTKPYPECCLKEHPCIFHSRFLPYAEPFRCSWNFFEFPIIYCAFPLGVFSFRLYNNTIKTCLSIVFFNFYLYFCIFCFIKNRLDFVPHSR